MIRAIFFLVFVVGVVSALLQHIYPSLWEVIALMLAASAFAPRLPHS